MKPKYVLGLLLLFGLLACCTNDRLENSVEIRVYCTGYIDGRTWVDYQARNGKDFIKLWIDDSLIFAKPYLVNCTDSTTLGDEYFSDLWGMKVADYDIEGKDSINIKVRIICLDTLLFGNKSIIDTAFTLPIDSIRFLIIDDNLREGGFAIYNEYNNSEAFVFELPPYDGDSPPF